MHTIQEDNVPNKATRIPPEVLSEQWFSFVHDMIGGLQAAYRQAQEHDPSFNQKVLAERVGLKPSFVSRCLSGQQNMTTRTIYIIGRGLNCRPRIAFEPLWTLAPANYSSAQNRQPIDIQHQIGAGDGNSFFYGEPATKSASSTSVPVR
jgi:hypothetical protein